MLYLLRNWGKFARGICCPITLSQLNLEREFEPFNLKLGYTVENALIELSKKRSIKPIIQFYCYEWTLPKIAGVHRISTQQASRLLDSLEDDLYLILQKNKIKNNLLADSY